MHSAGKKETDFNLDFLCNSCGTPSQGLPTFGKMVSVRDQALINPNLLQYPLILVMHLKIPFRTFIKIIFVSLNIIQEEQSQEILKKMKTSEYDGNDIIITKVVSLPQKPQEEDLMEMDGLDDFEEAMAQFPNIKPIFCILNEPEKELSWLEIREVLSAEIGEINLDISELRLGRDANGHRVAEIYFIDLELVPKALNYKGPIGMFSETNPLPSKQHDWTLVIEDLEDPLVTVEQVIEAFKNKDKTITADQIYINKKKGIAFIHFPSQKEMEEVALFSLIRINGTVKEVTRSYLNADQRTLTTLWFGRIPWKIESDKMLWYLRNKKLIKPISFKIVKNKKTNNSKGCAWVTFEQMDAFAALKLKPMVIKGMTARFLTVEQAKQAKTINQLKQIKQK